MKEDFLHYLWAFKKFDFLRAQTTHGEDIQIFKTGQHNQDQAGPDFFNAKLKIDDQLWAGNVEIHLKSSDWYAHHHETDPAYDNVILHVVWEHDVEVYRKDNVPIPTLTLKECAHKNALVNYRRLLRVKNYNWINCEHDFPDFSDFDLKNWLERLYIERLEEKSKTIYKVLKQTTNNWEATLFCLLAKNFGLNVNGEAFLKMALSTPFSVVRKMQNITQMEALLFGQAGMLQRPHANAYFQTLKSEYAYVQRKFKLQRKGVFPVSYFRLRPQNFPTIRLAQLAAVLVAHKNLFDVLIAGDDIAKIQSVFKEKASAFWETHYTFDKKSKPRLKKLTKRFVDLVIINTVVPLKFCYFTQKGETNHENLFELMRRLPKENNSIVKGFNRLRPKTAENALGSQALLQLKNKYCDKNHCLQCHLGIKLLQKERA